MQNPVYIYASLLFLCSMCSICVTNSYAQTENSPEENLYVNESGKPDSSKINSLIKYGETKEETDRDEAIRIYERAAGLSQRINYFLGAGKAYNYAGNLYSDKGDFEKAIQFNEKAIFYYSKINYKSGIGSAYCNIGNVHKFQGENKEALGYYLKGIALLEEMTDSSRLTILYNNIGALFSSLKNNIKAVEYSQKALTIAEKTRSDPNILSANINLSIAYTNEKDTVKAIHVLSNSLPIANKIKDYKILNYLHNNLGVIYMHQKKISEAAYHLNKALESSYKNGNPYDISSTYFSLGVFYERQKKWAQSEQFCKKALQIADSLQLHNLLAKTYNLLSDIEEERGNYKKAYEYYIFFTNYNDSVNSKDQLELTQEMEAKYQSTAKDKALSQKQLLIERSDAAIHNKNNLILFSISGIVIMVLLTLLIYFYNRGKRRLAAQQIKALEKGRELKVLQAMMDGEERERSRIASHLHDGIGGMVSAIKMHLGVSKLENEAVGKSEAYRQALHLLEDTAKEVRKTAHNLMPEVLHKYGLEEAIRLHCQSTSNKILEVYFQSYNLTAKLGSKAELLIYRIVQELVNNAVKHAECTELLIDLSQDEKNILISAEDNGKGFTPFAQNSKTGMGLSNIQSKAAALEGKSEVTSEPGTGTTITIELPLKNLELA